MSTVLEFNNLSSKQIKELSELIPQPVIVYPVGSIEQHGPFLPVGTDYVSSCSRAYDICKATGSILLTTHSPGYSPQHIKFPGTISFSSRTLLSIFSDVFDSLYSSGFHKILVINSHGTNTSIIQTAILDAKSKHHDFYVAFNHDTANSTMSKIRFKENLDIHAGQVETSFGMKLFPDLERTLPDFFCQDNRPNLIKIIQNKGSSSEIDFFLIKTLLPMDYSIFSESGIVGRVVIDKFQCSDDILRSQDNIIKFYVDFILAWNSLEASASSIG